MRTETLVRTRLGWLPLFAVACLLAALVPFAAPTPVANAQGDFPGWPETFDSRPLRLLPLSEIEQRFALTFPGRIGRFSDGERELIIRWISAPTRKLHPAADCFKGSGYDVKPSPLEIQQGLSWSAFSAERGNHQLHVREAILDASGQRWTDVSAWYWAATRGETSGPWWAITVAASAAPQSSAASVPLVGAE